MSRGWRWAPALGLGRGGVKGGREAVPEGPGAKRRALDAAGVKMASVIMVWVPQPFGCGTWLLGSPGFGCERCSALYRPLERGIRSMGDSLR